MKFIDKDKITKYTYYAVLFFLPISIFFNNLALIILSVSVALFKKSKLQFNTILLSSLLLLFIYILFLGVLNLEPEIKVYIKLLPLIIIPLVLSCFKKETLVKGLFFLFLAIIIKQFLAIIGVVDYYYFTEGKTVALRSYDGINDILGFERPYLGFFSAINIILAYRLFKQKKIWVFFITCLFSLFIIILISARLGLLIYIMSIVTILVSKIKINRNNWFWLIGFGVLLMLFFFNSNNPLKNRFQQLKYDTRWIVWQGALDVSENKASLLFGLQSQKKVEKELLNFYNNKVNFEYKPDKTRFLTKKYNTHNQYLNEFLRGGIFGLLLFILPIAYLIYNNAKFNNLEFTLLLLSLSLFFMVENLLARQIGVYTTAIILSLSRKSSYEKN